MSEMTDVIDLLEAEIVTSHQTAAGLEVAPMALFGGGRLAEVLKGLRAAGVNWWAWIDVALKLFAAFNPSAADVIKRILDAIKDGKTPATFVA